MSRDFINYIKIVNGIYFISTLIWMLFWFISKGSFNSREIIIIALFLLSIQIIILLYSLVFYFFTKEILLIKDQIKYSLAFLVAIIDLLFLINAAVIDGTGYIFLLVLNLLSILYILKNRFI